MSASFENLFGAFTRMMGQRTYEAMIATPISLAEVLVGDALYAATKASIASLAVPAVLLLVGEPVSPMVLLGLPTTVIIAFFFGSAALLVMAHSPDYGWFNYYITLVLTPMFLFSGVFFPPRRLRPSQKRCSFRPPQRGCRGAEKPRDRADSTHSACCTVINVTAWTLLAVSELSPSQVTAEACGLNDFLARESRKRYSPRRGAIWLLDVPRGLKLIWIESRTISM